ncbi:MAG: hypothetical protein JXB25_03975 [Deltaproteobacteria bacterium]|nr:hypothetical protein [Deltaproteobacteria bacterium]
MKRIVLLAVVVAAMAAGCSTRHEVQVAPVEVKPIHITIDVNVRVQKDLENFFGDIDEAQQQLQAKP